MLRHPSYTRDRIKQLGDRMQEKIYADRRALSSLQVSERTDRITRAAAMKLKFKPVKIGTQFGPLWATYWFKGEATIPKEWAGRRVDLFWNSHSEATLWLNGRSAQGLNYEAAGWNTWTRPDAVLTEKARGGETISFEIEMACNRLFGRPEQKQHQESISYFVLDRAEIALFDPAAWDLYFDFHTLRELEAELAKEGGSSDKAWAGELLSELNGIANLYNPADRSTWADAKKILKKLYTRKNATATHELSAIGHAHIDTAWLWPLAETHRKCTRTFSSAVAYMEEYPEFKFSCSQAYQYQAMKDDNPDLYKRIKERVKKGQFVPVGGTWIEPDCNIPSGEALARQFLVGQRFFEKEFGRRCKEFWNPDVFGYNGQLPQIMRLAGITRFLTQKLSWNYFNKPIFHTFNWQGIDGSEVLAHFPPADTYNAEVSIVELRRNAREYKDHDRSRYSMMLFGHGDGGGGPTKKMLETLARIKDLQGLPRTKMRSSDEFFTLLEKDCVDRPVMVGELYFELHRGTYTSQAATKRGNRKSEFLLHDVEFLSVLAKDTAGLSYPSADLEKLWRIVLLNQFHDILPGSSITLVYDDAKRHYRQVADEGGALRDRAIRKIVGGSKSGVTPINTIGFDRAEVAAGDDGKLYFVEAESYGIGRVTEATDEVTIKESAGKIVLENAHLKATLATDGRLLSLIEKETGRESLDGPGNRLQIFDDQPVQWEAWDVDPYHLETAKDCEPAKSHKIVSRSALRAEVAFERNIGLASKMKQVVRLDANAKRLEFHCDVDWQESKKFLKVAFPINARAMHATYEMQFGNVERPTHFNTTFDIARYEVPGHKWADLSEFGFGVALLSESKYGFSTLGNMMRMSLLRSPKAPDEKADMGRQVFSYAVFPHTGGWREGGVVAEGFKFNAPVRIVAGSAEPRSFAGVDDVNLVLDTIKKAEDDDAIVVRLYECHGARGTAKLRVDADIKSAAFCNILEDESDVARVINGEIEIPYRPYQVVSVKLRRR